MEGINDESLIKEFIVESREHLASIEPDLLILERDGQNTNAEIINRIFRAIHSIKGASGFFGFESLKSLSHSMENILMMVRDGKLAPSDRVTDPLLRGVDRLRDMLEDVQNSENIEFQDIVTQLDSVANSPEAEPTASSGYTSEAATFDAEPVYPQEPEAYQQAEYPPEITELASMDEPVNDNPLVLPTQSNLINVDRAQVEKAVQIGQMLYKIQVDVDHDLKEKNRTAEAFEALLLSTGSILRANQNATDIDHGILNPESLTQWQILYGTVLEHDLVSVAFNLPLEQCEPTTLEALFGEGLPAHQKESNQQEMSKPGSEQPNDIPAKERNAPLANKKPAANRSANSGAGSDSNETIRVKVDLLNRLMDLAGELVLARNQLSRSYESQANNTNDMGNIIQNIDLVTSDLQEHIMQTRMQAISSIFGKFPRVVRDLSRQLGKEIALEMSGEEVELDKSILESLSDPLTHLIRNCCDHALEKPDVREKAGKPRQGTILLKAYQESGHINIAVMDDGAGIDHEKIAKKALAAGIINEAALQNMSIQEQVNLIFMPGFSTAEKVTDVSGRGVGMDVVRTNIEQIGGSISIETEKGQGTSILLRLPLTLAIIPSLIVNTADQIFAVPQINLVELVCVHPSQVASRIEKVGSASILRLRGRLLPLIKLTDVLGLKSNYIDPYSREPKSDRREEIADIRQGQDLDSVPFENRKTIESAYNILVLKSGVFQYGLIVDSIKDIEEIVVKPLSQFIKNCKCFSGATIMGDGRVAMILDAAGIVSVSNLSTTEAQEEQRNKNPNASEADEDTKRESQSILLFTNAPEETFALTLSTILRIELIKRSDIEKVGNQRYLPYQGKSMTLIFLDEHLPVSPISSEQEELYVIIPLNTNCRVGIVASKLIDTFEFRQELDPPMVKNPSLKGSAVIQNHVTLFLDHEGLIKYFKDKSIEVQRSREWPAEHLQPSY